MSAGRCPIAGCNYPEGDCLGACLSAPEQARAQIEAARQAQADLDAFHQVQRVEDSLSAASLCAMGLLSISLVGLAGALGMAWAHALIP
jgi:hypothetical protein